MADVKHKGLWQRFRESLRNLKEEMNRNSVANAGPYEAACCHKPVEELEGERARYRQIAEKRRRHGPTGPITGE